MILSVASLDALFGAYMFNKLAMDSARASDTPNVPVKRYKVNAASHPVGL